MRYLWTALATVCITLAPLQNASADDSLASKVAPFVDDQTVAILHFDVAHADVAKIQQLLRSLSGDPDSSNRYAAALVSWLPRFVKAGGTEVYLVFSMTNWQRDPCFAIVPLASGVDPKEMLAVLGTVPAFKELVRTPIGNSAIFVGGPESLERVKNIKPVERKEITKALSALGSGTIQLVFMPPADTRRLIEEVVPTLPAELGGGSVKVLTRGLGWAAAALDISGTPSFRLVVQSEDASRAIDLANFWKTNLERVSKNPAALAVLPDLPSMEKSLIPSVAGDRLSLTLDGEKLPGLFKPLLQRMQDQSDRMASINKLKQLGLAVHNYYDVNKALPTFANFGPNGKPLLSWRVLLLPFVGQQKLYQEFHLDEPWDSEHNKKLIPRMPEIFKTPGYAGGEHGMTTYLAPLAENAIWTGTAAKVKLSDITDGTSNTILLIDAADNLGVPWTKPADYAYDPKHAAAGLSQRFDMRALVLRADGSVGLLPAKMEAAKILALFTRNGGEVSNDP